MTPKLYKIYFKGGTITVSALNYKEAKILAQAEAIKKGWDYTIVNEVDINNLPKEFKFESNINTLVSWYYAVEKEDCYVVTSDSGCVWDFDKDEIRSHLLKGDYEIIEEVTK